MSSIFGATHFSQRRRRRRRRERERDERRWVGDTVSEMTLGKRVITPLLHLPLLLPLPSPLSRGFLLYELDNLSGGKGTQL